MINKKFVILGMVLALALILLLPFFSAYAKSSVQFVSPGVLPSGFSSSGGEWIPDRTMCEAGQDFIVEIPPFGCDPIIVRSDLLEEQNVPVFCKLSATKINPLIGVEAIDSINFAGQQLPPTISGVGFFPAQAALGVQGKLNSPVLNNIGYAVIVLKKQPNASAMPEMVSGNLTATLKYNVKEAYGFGDSRFYLSEISDENVWKSTMNRSRFWNGKGYLRAESIGPESARISVYTDTKKLNTISLEKGKTSSDLYLPGFDCMVGMKITLEDLVSPNTRAILNINGDTVQVNQGEKFLDNKCTLSKVETRGLTKKAEIVCTEDDGTKRFELVLTPRVKLEIPEVEKKEFDVGDFLYESSNVKGRDGKVSSKNLFVYLGYIGTKGDSGRLDDLYVTLVATPVNSGSRLSASDIAKYSIRAEDSHSDLYKDQSGLTKAAADLGKSTRIMALDLFDSASGQTYIKYIPLKFGLFGEVKEEKTFGEKTITVVGFASPINSELKSGGAASKYYTSASQDYSKVVSSFGGEKYPSVPTNTVLLGEEAFIQNIFYAGELNQKQELERLCKEFKSTYPDIFDKNYKIKNTCDTSKLSSATSSSKEISINLKQKVIALEDVVEPSFEEFGVRLKVTNSANKEVKTLDLRKDRVVFFGDNDKDYVQLKEINKESVLLNVNRPRVSTTEQLKGLLYESNLVTLEKKGSNSFGTAYNFEIMNIYEKKNAKVSVVATVNRAQTDANFSFNIGIEQRSIKLSPEQTKERIASLNKTITEWKNIDDQLTKVVEGMKGACLATGLALTMKNFVNNLDGQSIARQKVMLSAGGWNSKCQQWVNDKTEDKKKVYKSVDECIMNNADEIDRDVEKATQVIKTLNKDISDLQETANCKIKGEGLFFEEVMNPACVKTALSKQVYSELESSSLTTFEVNKKPIDKAEVLSLIKAEKVSVEDLRSMQLNLRLDKESGFGLTFPKTELNKTLVEIYNSNQQELAAKGTSEKFKISSDKLTYVAAKDAKTYPYYGFKFDKAMKEKTNLCIEPDVGGGCVISDNAPIAFILTSNGKEYLTELEQRSGKLFVKNVFAPEGVRYIPISPIPQELSNVNFELLNPESYSHAYKSSIGSDSAKGPLLRCYDTAPYKGYPAIAPVNTKTGWYVAMSQNLPAFGGTATYQDSGKVMSFYICNVWENNQEENRGGDDRCTMINMNTGQPITQIGGLDAQQASKLVAEAIGVIEKGQKACQTGKAGDKFNLGPNAQNIQMGTPAANIPDMQCTAFMSPNDCKILFNVCDPVICPNSRCNFGGKYVVKDVIASGIIGSLLLCFPNFIVLGGDVYIPICLSGIKAGIDSWLSILEAYRDCLQENLATGQMVGICDQVYSVHLCELVWRQALPLAKMIVPKTIELIMGKSVRGGGEYLSVQEAWTTAGKSSDYFIQYYAAEAYTSFKTKIVQGVTDEVCKTYISGAYPEGGKIIDSLTNANSPPQFTGSFQEIPFTTATNPPISQYKVFYHIYAGQQSRAYYQVYLKSTGESSYYQDTATKLVVATGYIAMGGKESQTKDFTAVSGYKQMCIVINGKEDCGFSQVSSSFALDYVADQYVKEQANETGITSETNCVAGTPSAWSLATTSIEGAASSLASPAMYNRGIIRICATENPGSSTDKDATNPRWVSVGYCGEKTLKCWLDKESVKAAANFNYSVDSILGNLTADFLKQMKDGDKYMTDVQFSNAVTDINKLQGEKNFVGVVNYVNGILAKVLMNSEKGKLYLLRGNAYGELAKAEYDIEKAEAERLRKEKEAAAAKDAAPVGSAVCPSTMPSKASAYFSAINFFKDIDKDVKYADAEAVKQKIDGLYNDGLITLSEYNSIKGILNWITFGKVNDPTPITGQNVGEIYILLKKKYEDFCKTTLPGECNDEKFKTLLYEKCNCASKKDKCGGYAEKIIEVSNTHGFPRLLFLSLMIQESGCNPTSFSGSSFGLMQINLGEHCGSKGGYGLSEDTAQCKMELTDPMKNIGVGAQILRKGYSTTSAQYKCYSFTFGSGALEGYRGKTEPAIDKTYSEWNRALRKYNGWACAKEVTPPNGKKYYVYADHSFVEKINARYLSLSNECGGSTDSSQQSSATPDRSGIIPEEIASEPAIKYSSLFSTQFFPSSTSVDYRYNPQKNIWEYNSITGWSGVENMISSIMYSYPELMLAKKLSGKNEKDGNDYLNSLKGEKNIIVLEGTGVVSGFIYYTYSEISSEWIFFSLTSWNKIDEAFLYGEFKAISKELSSKDKKDGEKYLLSLTERDLPKGYFVWSFDEDFPTITLPSSKAEEYEESQINPVL